MMSADQICGLARQISKAPAAYTTQSQHMLQLVLDDLSINRNLRVNLVTFVLNVPANLNGPVTLPVNCQRVYDLFFTINGIPHEITPIDWDVYDSLIVSPQVTNYPYNFAVDVSPTQDDGVAPTIWIYPMSTTPLPCQLRYFKKQAVVSDFEQVPWFLDQDYLLHATSTQLMKITNDDRWPAFVATGEEMLRKHLIMEGNRLNVPIRVKLDPTMYRPQSSLRPTKLTD